MEKTEPSEREYCEKWLYYEKEEMHAVDAGLQYEDLKIVRSELLTLQTKHKLCNGRLQAALNAAKLAAAKASSNFSRVQKLKQKVKALRAESEERVLKLQKENQILRAEIAARNSAIAQVHMLQEQIQSLRNENENLLTTIQDNFTTFRHADEKIENDVELGEENRRSKNKNLEKNQSFEEDDSYAKFWDTDDDDEQDGHLEEDEEDGHLEEESNLDAIDSAIGENKELPEMQDSFEKICLWIEPDQEPCHEIFKTAQELNEHVKNEHVTLGNNVCLWQNCNRRKMFEKKCGLSSHIRTHIATSSISTFLSESDDCESKLGRKSELDNHRNAHPQEDVHRYPCLYPGCGKSYTGKHNLVRHERNAHNLKYYKCSFPKCGKTCESYKEFKEHRSRHNTVDKLSAKNARHKKRFQCTFPGCNRKFYDSYNLEAHNYLHTSGKSFSCPVCSRMFSTQSAFDSHKAVHYDSSRFHCTFKGCKKSYSRKDRMLLHKNSHKAVQK